MTFRNNYSTNRIKKNYMGHEIIPIVIATLTSYLDISSCQCIIHTQILARNIQIGDNHTFYIIEKEHFQFILHPSNYPVNECCVKAFNFTIKQM